MKPKEDIQRSLNRFGLASPSVWVERVFQKNHRQLLTKEAELQQEKNTADQKLKNIRFCYPVIISYFPGRLQERGYLDFIENITSDLNKGFIVRESNLSAPEDGCSIVLLSRQWKIVLKTRKGKTTGRRLSEVSFIEAITIPTHQFFYLCDYRVKFSEIWNEEECDPAEILKNYSAMKAMRKLTRAICDEVNRSVLMLQHEHEKAFSAEEEKLALRIDDSCVSRRSKLHGAIRSNYAALRLMLRLLKLRSDVSKQCFPAKVLSNPPEHGITNTDKNHTSGTDLENPLRVKLLECQSSDILTEESLVEIQGVSKRKKARILSIESQDGLKILEVDLPWDTFPENESVTINTISRFSMRTHSDALKCLLGEDTHADWPDLARLLIAPGELDFSCAKNTEPQFFCDMTPGAPSLNTKQREAVIGALSSPHAFCIQGPPGTGKTTVICELVQQLIAKRERILLVAPTHVAVDEVLRRIGSRNGVHPLRLSWDELRIAEDVRKYTPENIIDAYIGDVATENPGNSRRWHTEREEIAVALPLLQQLTEIRKNHLEECQNLLHAEAEFDAAEKRLIEATDLLRDLMLEKHDIELELINVKEELLISLVEHDAVMDAAGWWTKFMGLFGIGTVGQSKRRNSMVQKSYLSKTRKNRWLDSDMSECNDTLSHIEIRKAEATKKVRLVKVKVESTDSQQRQIEAKCRAHSCLRTKALDAEQVPVLINDLQLRDTRLEAYQHLSKRFYELIHETKEQNKDLGQLRNELLAQTNLFCCTTTGIAGSKEIRDCVFDTLIVDEASRVTDSEFLIGALRAKRWILVGDEHQLPPYVEQEDEHFIHALSAIHQSEANGISLEDAVNGLGDLWEEDEELHQFRRDNVLEHANTIFDSGQWTEEYREAYLEEIKYLKEEEPSLVLLEAIKDSMVHSLFERIVKSCPGPMKVRLEQQRRMIEPIASIVSQPVYGGHYSTPAAKDLAANGITPLTTSTFSTPITFLDTSLMGMRARDKLVNNSFINPTEAKWIIRACAILDRELSQSGSKPVSVSILAFYKAQAKLIHTGLQDHEKRKGKFTCLRFSVIDSIDRIQGQESDVVFISFCRTAGIKVSSRFGQWLQDLRRLNVACTRAHRALFFVGQKELLDRLCSNEPAMQFYKHLNTQFETRPDVMQVIRQFEENQ